MLAQFKKKKTPKPNIMASIIEEKTIIKLALPKDWRTWINAIKSLAKTGKADVWEYINPDREIPAIITPLLAKLIIKNYKADIVKPSDLDAALQKNFDIDIKYFRKE